MTDVTAKDEIILVLGATGQQGGAVARHLLKDGWRVRALTRNPRSPAAQHLVAAGASLAEGDMADGHALTASLDGVYGVFSVQPANWQPSAEADAAEAAIGKSVADAAHQQGVRHFVYASVLAADGQRAFRPEAKGAVEAHIRALGLPFTILRPAGFMENYIGQVADLLSGSLNDPTSPDVAQSLVAVDDIGGIVAAVFAQPDDFVGRTMDVAGDKLTPRQIADALGAALGTGITHNHVPIDALRQFNPLLATLVEWLNATGYPPLNRDALLAVYPGLRTLPQWLADEGAERIRAAQP